MILPELDVWNLTIFTAEKWHFRIYSLIRHTMTKPNDSIFHDNRTLQSLLEVVRSAKCRKPRGKQENKMGKPRNVAEGRQKKWTKVAGMEILGKSIHPIFFSRSLNLSFLHEIRFSQIPVLWGDARIRSDRRFRSS